MTAATARTALRAAGFAVLLGLAGCGSADDGPPAEAPSSAASSPTRTVEPTAGPTSTSDPRPPGGATTGSTESDDPAMLAAQDLAERLGVPADDVSVVRTAPVTWRDASLGCPERGMAYAQVLTEGLLIELEVSGQTYEYHSGPARDPFLCERPEPPYSGAD